MKRIAFQVALLLGLTVIAAVATKRWHPYAPALYLVAEPLAEGEVLAGKAVEWEGQGLVLWIDARKRAEFEKEHAPGAMLLNEFEWDDILFEGGFEHLVSNGDKRFVVYCGNQTCKTSKKIAARLREKRFADVYVLKGGWGALKKALPATESRASSSGARP